MSEGLQGAVWALGGVPIRHRTDRRSAAVNNLSETKEFTSRYQSLMDHYGLEKELIQARQANENGDVESSHRHEVKYHVVKSLTRQRHLQRRHVSEVRRTQMTRLVNLAEEHLLLRPLCRTRMMNTPLKCP